MFRAIIFCSASSGCSVVSPWYRSGASATKPSAAKRSTILDVSSSAPPLLEHDHTRPAAGLGHGEVSGGGPPVGLELHVWHSALLFVCWSSSSRASSHPTATPTSIPIRVSSARRVRMAVARSTSSSAAGRLADLGLVRLPEPAPLVQRGVEHPLELRSDPAHPLLGLAEAAGLGQSLQAPPRCRASSTGPSGTQRRARGDSSRPISAPATAAPGRRGQVGLLHRQGQQDQHRGQHARRRAGRCRGRRRAGAARRSSTSHAVSSPSAAPLAPKMNAGRRIAARGRSHGDRQGGPAAPASRNTRTGPGGRSAAPAARRRSPPRAARRTRRPACPRRRRAR